LENNDLELKTEQDIINLIEQDLWMMKVLEAVKLLNLPDWWVCAGFVRSKIWDTLHGFTDRTPLGDIDVVYFDPDDIEESTEKRYERKLNALIPGLPWSVKNEARMHLVNGFEPYTSSVDAISKFPETVTALGVKLNEKIEVVLTAPCGIEDVLNMEVKPTELFTHSEKQRSNYKTRVQKKNWPGTWYKVSIAE
jgi:hypothetical protein